MQPSLSIKKLLTVCVAALLTAAGPSWAAPVDVLFDWNQSSPDPSTGSGQLAVNVNGVILSAPMPTPVLNQKDALLAGESFVTTGPGGEGVVGFANGLQLAQPGSPFGFHLGWSGTVTLTGSRGGTDFMFPVDLTYESGDSYAYSATVFDDPTAATDVNLGVNRFAGWIGDDSDGHRHSSQNNQDYLGGQDVFQISASGGLGNNGFGDNVGIGFALRNRDGGDTGSIFVADVSFGGTLQQDDSGILPFIPQPEIMPVDPTDPFDVVLDIGPSNQNVQGGHIGVPDPGGIFTPTAGTNGTNVSDIPIDIGTGTPVLMSISNNSLGGIDWRDRGDSINAAEDLVQMGEDFVKNNSGAVRLDLAQLPPGIYQATSYHRDPGFAQSAEILTLVDNGDGSGLVLQPGAVGNADIDIGGVDALTTANMEDTSASFTFTSDGLNPVTILFDGTAAADTEVPFNGMFLSYLPFSADFDGNGTTDDADLEILAMNVFNTNATFADGDADRNGIVDHRDYRIWTRLNAAAGSSGHVPEPASLGIALLGLVALLGSRQRLSSTNS